MREFHTVVIDDEEMQGNGYFETLSSQLQIQTNAHEILSQFKDKKRIKTISFKNKPLETHFCGMFMVSGVNGNSIELSRVE